MNKEEALKYCPLPWRCELVEGENGNARYAIITEGGEEVRYDPFAEQSTDDAANKCNGPATARFGISEDPQSRLNRAKN